MSKLLEKIKSPSDVRNLTDSEKELLCSEIRDVIINTISVNGGHLASNLGVVELTVALLSVFDIPKDTIIWDVGHQIYTHKILTGRYNKFEGIRTKGGLTGFPSRDESDCDPFTSGHSSTSISAALGVTSADHINGEDAHTVAVIGDGSLTGGLAFEGLNNAGRLKKNLIVILNDNKMAISKNVGSMARYLGYMRTRPGYLKAKVGVERVFDKVPLVGKPIASLIRYCKNVLKKTIYGPNIFEDMGFAYYGPFDGHNLAKLTETLSNAKEINKPVLLHVRTVKGKGYNYAESEPNIFHGVGGFNAVSGKVEPSGENFSSVFGDTVCELAEKDKRICCITAAMASGTGLVQFASKYKNRFFDVGIAEGHAVTFAAGLARKGLVPYFAVYSTFLQRAYDNLLHDVALQKLKVVICIDRAGVVGEDGRTHHGLYDAAFLRTIPETTVFSPCYYDELRDVLKKTAEEDFGHVCIRYPRGKETPPPTDFVFSGDDWQLYGDAKAPIAIVTYGRVFSEAVEAVRELRYSGIDAKIIKLNKITPVSDAAVAEAMNSRAVFFFEEGMKQGGVSEGMAALMADRRYRGIVNINAVDNAFIPHGTMKQLLSELKLDREGIVSTITEKLLSLRKD